MNFLKKIYGIKPIKRHLSKIIFKIKNRPSVDPESIGKLKSAVFLISADFELGWAFRYSKKNNYPEKMAKRARENFPFLLKIFEDYKIPITWATVGHLFLRGCKRGEHDWMRKIPYFENRNWIYKTGDWFDCDPYTQWDKATTWYAPDLIENILNSNIGHEIGSHTFSHIDMTYKNCPSVVADDELKACVDAAKELGIKLNSFVFPGGTYGNYETLVKYGIKTIRKTMSYELSIPKYDKGLLMIPVSTGLADNGLGWSKEYFFKRYKAYIDKAIETKTICHFWFHPSIDKWFLHNVFPNILKYAAQKRDEGKIKILTMKEITEKFKEGKL